MSYELSDKMILRGELMKYRRSLCEQVSEFVWSINLIWGNVLEFIKQISEAVQNGK